ncbi:MAG: Abi family protein [Akkermansia sp.]
MDYLKQHLSLSLQADLLIKRGLLANKSELEQRLADVSYYRLSSYWYPFRLVDPVTLKQRDDLLPNTSLELIWDHYIFDRQLRFLLMDAIERIEVSIRSRLVYFLTETDGPFGYTSSSIFCDSVQHQKWIEKVHTCVKRARQASPCIKHFFNTYGDKHTVPPLWITAEVLDFGGMSRLFSGVRKDIRNKVVKSLGISAAVLDSWLTCLNAVRNSCAHHEYIWCRAWINKPMLPKADASWKSAISSVPSPPNFYRDGTGTILVMCRYLLRIIAPTSEWHRRVEALFARFASKGIDYSKMGLPQAWQSHPLWK